MYEETPGEAIRAVIISPANSPPCTPADVTPRYFDLHTPTAPSLPPPRNGSVITLPKLETIDEIDAMKAAIKDGKIPQSGDEYMIMGGPKPEGQRDVNGTDKSKGEEVYTMMK